ncbi:hypothetical protein L6386_00615 [bacterium]|nr:hypothetical protein [bacterium]MBU4561660.1 hypothetical protein [bacterium]MCG2676460.1 hypothetical protein [bacterium]MCG2677060.1 hypothetical protein [bacterium]
MAKKKGKSAPSGKKKEKGKEIEEGKVFAALSYLWLLSVIILFGKKEDKFVAFHAKQGVVLFGCIIAGWIICLIPYVRFLGWIVRIACWAGMLIGIIKSLGEEKFKIPLVGDLAEKIKV